jgi:hypothetical protein
MRPVATAAMVECGGIDMAEDLKGMRVAILAADGVERAELEHDALLVLGGAANSDILRVNGDAVGFVADFHSPADLPNFCAAVVAHFAGARV